MRSFSIQKKLLFCLLGACSYVAAQECSTEKVNNDCTVTIDRAYPVALPTIQLRHGRRVIVRVQNGLPFEVLSLDLQTGQAVAGTDQTAGFLSAALPNLKGLLVTQQLNTGGTFGFLPPPNPNVASAQVSRTQIDTEQARLNNYFHLMHLFAVDATVVYNQLNEVFTAIPPEVLLHGQRLATSNVGQDVPRPWISAEYGPWLSWIRCEIAAQECSPELPSLCRN